MATKLEKDITRESSEQVDGREIMITITEDQTIELILKGMKSGRVEIPIKDLFEQLSGGSNPTPGKVNLLDEGAMVSVNKLRSLNAVTKSSIEVLAKIDSICVELLTEHKAEVKAATPKKEKKPITQ